MNLARTMSIGAICIGLIAASAAQAQVPPPMIPGMKEHLRERAISDLATRLDAFLLSQHQKHTIEPAPIADDAEFLRRVYLDLVGRIPRVSEARDFLDDPRTDKRARLVDVLIRRPSFYNHVSATLRADWMPQAENNPQLQFQSIQVENWLRERLREGAGYDVIVRRLLTAPTVFQFQRGQAFNPVDQGTQSFYQLNENKPENLAATATRLFLGVKLECAQCHDHPFAPYTREQFWEVAAFFAEITPNPQGVRPQPTMPVSYTAKERTIKIPNTERSVTAKFLDGAEPVWNASESPRKTFADWLTSPTNPYFARNVANRMWFHFFGTGFIDPIDEPGDENQPSHPELLDALAKSLVEHHFDITFLMQAITRTQAYQRTSRLTHPSQEDPRQFAKMAVKGLSSEQLWSNMVVATGYRDPLPANQRRFAFNANQPRGEFLNRFGSTERQTERQTSILQALMLMNGRFITDQTSLDRSEILTAVVEMPFGTINDKLDILFLSTVGRKPTPLEMQKFRSYVDRGGPSGDSKKAYADVFWALLNSSEFMLNH